MIYCDKKKPNMITFLGPLIDRLNEWFTNGLDITDTSEGPVKLKTMLFIVSADLPAWAKLMNMKYYTGKFSCQLCDQEGSPYDANNRHRAWPYDEEI